MKAIDLINVTLCAVNAVLVFPNTDAFIGWMVAFSGWLLVYINESGRVSRRHNHSGEYKR